MLDNKIKYSFLLLFWMFTSITKAQQVYVETGFGSAFFEDYVNNLGENTLDDSYSRTKTPFFETGFRFNLYRERIHLNFGTSYNTYKINTAFSSGNIKIPTSYDLSYLTLKLGVNISILKWKRLKVQLHSHISHDWLTAGTNKYNNVVLDIYRDRTLDRTLLRFHRGIGLQYEISDEISAYMSYNFANSIQEKNKDSQNGESYSFETKSLSVGVLFNVDDLFGMLFKYNKK